MKKYKVVEVDSFFRAHIDIKGKSNEYGEPKLFNTRKEAENWVKKHSYKGMSFGYDIMEVVIHGTKQ